jgi:energy-coupling factor transport system ATP-binding protein
MGASLAFSDASFTYATSAEPALEHADLWIPAGAFCVVTGPTGSGKSTLLGLLDPETCAGGSRTGSVFVGGADVATLSARERLGAVSRMPQNAGDLLVAQTVESQVAFALESLGMEPSAMRVRVAEVCGFLNIAPLARRKCDELSRGQASLAALASAVAPFPDVLVCDEPTASLDPEATRVVADALFRLNRELGTTVVVATHNPYAYKDIATHAYRCDAGRVEPQPTSLLAQKAPYCLDSVPPSAPAAATSAARLRDVWIRYGRKEPFVLEGFTAAFPAPGVHALVGAHGSGKTTVLKALAGLERPFHGSVANPWRARQVYLPQDPTLLFRRETVREELSGFGAFEPVLERLGCASLADRHTDELSGGQAALVAFAKVVLSDASLLLLDEPTAALDHAHAQLVAQELVRLAAADKTVVLVAHDMELVRAVAASVTLVFAGAAAATLPPREFFAATRLFV